MVGSILKILGLHFNPATASALPEYHPRQILVEQVPDHIQNPTFGAVRIPGEARAYNLDPVVTDTKSRDKRFTPHEYTILKAASLTNWDLNHLVKQHRSELSLNEICHKAKAELKTGSLSTIQKISAALSKAEKEERALQN